MKKGEENTLSLKCSVHRNLCNIYVEIPSSSHSLCSRSLPVLRLFPLSLPAELPCQEMPDSPSAITPQNGLLSKGLMKLAVTEPSRMSFSRAPDVIHLLGPSNGSIGRQQQATIVASRALETIEQLDLACAQRCRKSGRGTGADLVPSRRASIPTRETTGAAGRRSHGPVNAVLQ